MKAPKPLRFGHKARKSSKRWAKKEHSAFYDTRQWRQTSISYRQRFPLCEICDAKGFTVEAACVDHIEPIQDGGAPWNEDNFQSLCNSCHAKKTGKETAERRK